jgi:hypothetical protein
MERQIRIRGSRYLAIFAIIFTIAAINACRVQFIPAFDAKISEQIDLTSKAVDKFYLTMLETTSTENDGRAFKKFADEYVEIEVELNSLLNKNKIRPLNKNSTRICEITLQLWQKYKLEHKDDNTLSDGLIKLNNKTFSDLFYAMQVAEKGKELTNNPPE